jgi:hypothetical protein
VELRAGEGGVVDDVVEPGRVQVEFEDLGGDAVVPAPHTVGLLGVEEGVPDLVVEGGPAAGVGDVDDDDVAAGCDEGAQVRQGPVVVGEVVHGVDGEDEVEQAVAVGGDVEQAPHGEGRVGVRGAGHVDLAVGDVDAEDVGVPVGQQSDPAAGAAAEVDGAVAGRGQGGFEPGSVDDVGVGGEDGEQLGQLVEVHVLLGGVVVDEHRLVGCIVEVRERLGGVLEVQLLLDGVGFGGDWLRIGHGDLLVGRWTPRSRGAAGRGGSRSSLAAISVAGRPSRSERRTPARAGRAMSTMLPAWLVGALCDSPEG